MMRLGLLGLALVLATATASPSSAASRACSPAAARAAIAQAKPKLALNADKVSITPGQADAVLCFDLTADGRADMAVSLFSGGTAGDVGWLVFVPGRARWRLAAWGSGYKLALRRLGSGLEVVQPVYRKKDPNCCPTGGFDRALYRWNGSRLVVARTWHTKSIR